MTDEELARIVVRLGYVSGTALDEARSEASSSAAGGEPRPLAEVLKALRYLTDRQLAMAETYRSAEGSTGTTMGDLIVARRLATAEQVAECLDLRRQRAESGSERLSLARLLEERGYLDEARRKETRRLHGEVTATIVEADRSSRETGQVLPLKPVTRRIEKSASGADDIDIYEGVGPSSISSDAFPVVNPNAPPGSDPFGADHARPDRLASRKVREPDTDRHVLDPAELALSLFADERLCEACGGIMAAHGTRCGHCQSTYCPRCKALHDPDGRCLDCGYDPAPAPSSPALHESNLAIVALLIAGFLVLALVAWIVLS